MCQGSHLRNGLSDRGVKTLPRSSASEWGHSEWPHHSWSKVPGSFSSSSDWALTCLLLTSNQRAVGASNMKGSLDRVYRQKWFGVLLYWNSKAAAEGKDKYSYCLGNKGWNAHTFNIETLQRIWPEVLKLGRCPEGVLRFFFYPFPMQGCKFHMDRCSIFFSCFSTSIPRKVSGT